MIKRSEQDQTEEDLDEEDLDETLNDRVEEARSLLERLEENRRESKDGSTVRSFVFHSFIVSFSGRLDDELLTQIFKIKLSSPPCQNQGYVLDGYPKTMDQAQSLFGGSIGFLCFFLIDLICLCL